MSTDNPESAFALDEGAMRALIQEKAPEVFTSDPEENGRQQPDPVEAPAAEEPSDSPEETADPLTTSLEDAITESQKTTDQEAADAKALADAETAKKAAAAPAVVPHPDLDDEIKKLDPHTKPKTRQIIEGIKSKVITERDRAVKAEKAQADIQRQFDELKAQATSGKPPKAVEDELNLLRERVRELDVTKDPQIEAKYDKPIQGNTDAAINLLGELGIFNVRLPDKDGQPQTRPMTDKEKAAMTAQIKNNGVSIRTMAQHIKLLENAGDVENAEALRDLARENDRLARDKGTEIQQIKGNFEGRQQARTKEQQAVQENISKIAVSTSEETLRTNLSELAKVFPQVNRPPDPLATDAAPVAAAKKAAIAAYDQASEQVSKAAQMFNASGLTDDKAAQVRGRTVAAAIESIVLKSHLLPAMQKDNAALQARVKELEAQVGTFRKAGTVNRAHSAAITSGNGAKPDVSANANFAESLAASLKGRGVDINS